MGVRRRLAGVAAGLVLDRLLGDPSNAWHPVAWFGSAMGAVEKATWADRRTPGRTYAATGVALGAGTGWALSRLPGGLPVAVWIALGGTSLRTTSQSIGDRLDAGDLAGARRDLPVLVGRDPSHLDESGIAAAVIESVAENAVDAVVAPILWAMVGGAPGVLAHRAINTMDAMVGHRNERYRQFGWAAARLDDVAAWLPARLQAALVMAVRPGSAVRAWQAVRIDAPAHPSPNSGVAEAAAAGALGVQLGGRVAYGSRVEDRPLLGRGPRPLGTDIARATRLVDDTELLLLAALAVGVALGSRVSPAAQRAAGENGPRARRSRR